MRISQLSLIRASLIGGFCCSRYRCVCIPRGTMPAATGFILVWLGLQLNVGIAVQHTPDVGDQLVQALCVRVLEKAPMVNSVTAGI